MRAALGPHSSIRELEWVVGHPKLGAFPSLRKGS